MIEIKDIEKLAALSRIKISDAEKETLRGDIDSILAYVGQIQSAPAAGNSEHSDNAASKNLPNHRNVFRDDGVPHESGIHTEALLKEAPERDGNYLKVKDIF